MSKTMKTKTTAKKSVKKTSRWSRFSLANVSTKTVRSLMFILSFAIIGSWYLISTHANSGYGVRFVFVCASNACSGSEAELRGYSEEIRNWYQGQVGRTFVNLGTTSYRSPRAASYFGAGSNSTDQTYYNLYSELQGAGLIQDNVKTVVMLGFRSMSNCGVGGFGDNLAIADPFKGCSNIKSAVLAHELGHNLALPGTNADGMHDSDGQLMHAPLACNGRALSNCSLNQADRNTAYSSAWFAPPAPKSTIQGFMVRENGAAASVAQVVYTCCNIAGNPNNQSSNPYFFRNVDQGLHRVAVANIDPNWEVVGATVCYDRTNCHGGTPTPLSANPDAGPYKGLPSIVIDTRGHGYADLWFHFRPKSSPPADDSSLVVKVSGYGGAVLMTAVTSSDGARHTVGRCTELGGGYQFNVTNSRTCTGERIGPIAIQPQALNGYTFAGWSNCSGGAQGSICYVNRYDSGSQTITATYRSNSGESTTGNTQNVTFSAPYAVRTQNNKCLDVPGQNFKAGTVVQIYDCNGTVAQKWVAGTDGTVRTTNGWCLDVPQQNFANGTKLQLWTCNGTIAQKFTGQSDGTVHAYKAEFCWDVPGQKFSSGVQPQLWTCNGTIAQKWAAVQ